MIDSTSDQSSENSKVTFNRIKYAELNAKQQENYNFQKVSGLLADYGFTTIRLTDDWEGADFIGIHKDGGTVLKVQLKGRFTISKKYIGKDVFVCFPDNHQGFYLYPHDKVMAELLDISNITKTDSWKDKGEYYYSVLTGQLELILKPYHFENFHLPTDELMTNKRKQKTTSTREVRRPITGNRNSTGNSYDEHANQPFTKIDRIKRWANHPEQYNHKIIKAYLELSKHGDVLLTEFQNYCSNTNSNYYVNNFFGHFSSMKTDNGNSHGKVFYVDNGIVKIYPVVIEEIQKYFK